MTRVRQSGNARLAAPALIQVTPTAPFTECPAIGNATSCDVLVQITNAGNVILDDPSQGPYDGSDDTLIGVVNNSSTAVSSISLSSNTDLFGFDGDGLCTYAPVQPGCPFGPTGYEGPGTSFTNINQNVTGGTVNFAGGLAPGASAYFSLEERLTASAVVAGGPSRAEQGGAPNSLEKSTTCHAGAPVNCATGDFWHTFSDASVPGRGVQLSFQRTYDAAAASADGPLGFGWSDSYGMSLAIDPTSGAATVTEGDGSQVQFQSNGFGGFTAAPRVLASLTQNPDGSYTLISKPSQLRDDFSAAGQLVDETDRNGYTTTLSYTAGQLTAVTDPAGRTLIMTYNGTHLATLTDPLDRKTTYSYDTNGNLASSTDAAGRTWTYAYDTSHRLLSMTDPRGGATTNTYDSVGRVASQSDPMGRTMNWSYVGDAVSPGGGTTTLTDPNGNQTIYDYANLELADVTHAAGTPVAATTRYNYDPATLDVSASTDPNGNTTTNTYDLDGNLTGSTDPLGRTTSYLYDSLDDLTSKTLPSGHTTSYTYDSAGNLTAITDATGAQTTFSYGDPIHPGDVTSVTDRDGRVSTLGYDAQGDLASTTTTPATGVSDTTTSVYDADGERTCSASANATAAHVACPSAGGAAVADTTSTTFDSVGEIQSVTDPNGHNTSYAYDADGNRTKVTDPNGHVTTSGYDADNEPSTTVRADGTQLAYTYDKNGNQLSQTDGAGNTTNYSYDALNRQISSTDPLGRTTTTNYDLAGNPTKITDPSGRTTTDTSDSADQLTGVTYSDGTTPAVSYAYTADGQRASMTDGTGTSTYSYDALDRLSGNTNGAGATSLYGYNNSGQLTSLTYPSGQLVTRTYDGAGREASLTDWLGKTFTFTYDASGNETGQADPNGVTASSAYDNTNELTSITDKTATATLGTFNYNRDALGQPTSATPTGVAGATPETYAYTNLNQLSAVNAASYSYDHADNLIKLTDGTSQTYDAANELTSATPPASTAPTSALAVDQTVSADQKTSATKLTSPSITTHAASELILALISADGPRAKAQTITTVTGAGLTFTLAARSNATYGTAEIWQAHATTTVTGKITATLARGGYDGSITITSFTGAGPVITTKATTSGISNKATDPITPAADSSLIYTAGHDWSRSSGATAASGQTLIHQFRDSRVHDSFWTQRATASSAKHTPVTIADTLGGSDRWQLAAVEIPAAAPGGGGGTTTPTTYKYDSQGNRISATNGTTTTTYKYDQANRLTGVGTNGSYTYNGDGLRQAKTVGTATTTFDWDASGNLPLLLQDGPDGYVYGPDGLPVEKITGSAPTYLLHDQQGSTRLLTDASGAVAGTYSFTPYGLTTSHTGVASSSLQYDGQYTDAETGFQYLRARYYDPATGQFMSPDPLYASTQSRYGLADDSPVDGQDPSGLFCVLGHNPNGSCRGSNVHNDLRVVKDVSTGVAIVGGLVLLCVATACAGDAAVAALGASTLAEVLGIEETVGAIGYGLAEAGFFGGLLASIGSDVMDCAPSLKSAECISGVVGTVLDVVLHGFERFIPEGLFNVLFGGFEQIVSSAYDYVRNRALAPQC